MGLAYYKRLERFLVRSDNVPTCGLLKFTMEGDMDIFVDRRALEKMVRRSVLSTLVGTQHVRSLIWGRRILRLGELAIYYKHIARCALKSQAWFEKREVESGRIRKRVSGLGAFTFLPRGLNNGFYVGRGYYNKRSNFIFIHYEYNGP